MEGPSSVVQGILIDAILFLLLAECRAFSTKKLLTPDVGLPVTSVLAPSPFVDLPQVAT